MIRFTLPDRGALSPTGRSDPHRYYYVPILGRLFTARLNLGLGLLAGLPRPGRVLELGYGSGLLMPTLCQMADEVAGIDLCSEPARVLADLGRLGVHPQALLQGDVRRLPFPDGHFDLVVAFSIFEHLREADLLPALAEAGRVLRAGGHLLVGCPAVHAGMSLAFLAIGFRGIDDHHVSDIRSVTRLAAPHFERRAAATLPKGVPLGWGLYNAVLFRKKQPGGGPGPAELG